VNLFAGVHHFPHTLLQPIWLKQFGVATTLARAYNAPNTVEGEIVMMV
jgi:hypothetical protein